MSQLRRHLSDVGVEILGEDDAGFEGPGFGVYIEDDIVKAVSVFGEEYQQKLLALYE